MVSPKLARMLTFFSQFDFSLHHVKCTSNVVADALSRPSRVTPLADPSLASMPRLHDCGQQCVVRDTTLRRHGLQLTSLCSLLRLDQELLLDVHELRGVSGVLHPVGVNQIQQVQVQDQVQHIEFVVSGVHLSPAMKKLFKVGYAHDREFMSALNKVHEKYVLKNELLFLKTRHAVN